MPDAKTIIARYDTLKAKRATYDTEWQRISEYVMPRLSQINTRKTPGVESYSDSLFDMTAVEANETLAAGRMSYSTPGGQYWFEFQPPAGLPEALATEAREWLKGKSETAHRILWRSNWNHVRHEGLLVNNAFGTSAHFIEDIDGEPVFYNLIPGSFAIDQNYRGDVDTLMRKFKLTARQAQQQFGDELPEKLAKAAADEKQREQEFEFVHLIEPRPSGKPGAVPEGKPWASYYVCVEDQTIVQEGGFDEQPFAVGRYLTQPGEVYGFCPGFLSLPYVMQVNYMERDLDTLSEVAANPRVLTPAYLAGAVDLRAGGETIFEEGREVPKEWATQGRYDIGMDRAEQKREAIRRAFFVDLFTLLQNKTKEMTAFEVAELAEERIVQFSPIFALDAVEVLNPILRRVFGILLRSGKFGSVEDIPLALRGPDGVSVLAPEITYVSKIALAIKAIENRSMRMLLEALGVIASLGPEALAVLDNFDFDKLTRRMAMNLNVPQEALRTLHDVQRLRQERAQMQQVQAAVQMGKDVAQGIGQLPPEAARKMTLGR